MNKLFFSVLPFSQGNSKTSTTQIAVCRRVAGIGGLGCALLLGHGLPEAVAAPPAAEVSEKYAPKPDDAMTTSGFDQRYSTRGEPVPEAGGDGQLLMLDAQSLLEQPALLERAMRAAIKTQNIAGIRSLLPIYQQYPGRAALVEELAQALLARADAKPAYLARHLRRILQRHPGADAIRFQLATALHADRQYVEAEQELTRLQQAPLPAPLQEEITLYRSAIAKQSQWRWYAGFHFINEKNINNAPNRRWLGTAVHDPVSGKNTVHGFVFDKPIHGRGIGYQFGGGRRLLWPEGFFGALDIDAQGKHIFQHTKYNDLLLRVSPAVGHARWRDEWQLGPFVERRWFGSRPYASNIGVSARWKRNWTPRILSFMTAEYGRQTHDERRFLDNRNTSLSGTVFYQHSERQYWQAGVDYARESGTRDADDRFRRHNIRLMWGQAWPQKINTQISVSLGKSRYDGPSLFSKGQPRQDRERSVSLAIWKQNWQWGGLTPRLMLSRQQVRSNDLARETAKTRAMMEVKRDW